MGPKHMRILVRLLSTAPLVLPFAYREALQGLIYRALPKPLSSELHNRGILHMGRPWRLFVFSRLRGNLRADARTRTLRVQGEVHFRFASARREVAEALGEGLLRQGDVQLMGHRFHVVEVAVLPEPQLGCEVHLRALSPITAYRTEKRGGRRFTRYFNPLDKEFGVLVEQNLRRKAEAIGMDVEGEVVVEALGLKPRHKHIETYKGTVIEAWSGRYRLRAPKSLVWVALHAGLGAKGSQGFGYVEVEA